MLTACARPSGVWGLSHDTGEVRQFPCASPRCPGCAPRWGRALQARLARVLPQILKWRDCPQRLKFGTLTLPPKVDATLASLETVEADNVVWRRFKRQLARADPPGRVFAWKREVGARGGRLHRHFVVVTSLSNRVLKKLAARAGAGHVNFKLANGGALANYLAKYIAKPGADLSAWPSRTRWAQTIIPVVPRQAPIERWIVRRFGRITSERAVLSWVDWCARTLAAPPEASAKPSQLSAVWRAPPRENTE